MLKIYDTSEQIDNSAKEQLSKVISCSLPQKSVCEDLEIADLLLQKGAEPDLKVGGGYTPLILAALGECPGIVKRLLQEDKVDLDHKSEQGETALWGAAECGNTEIVQLLLERGVELNPKDKEGRTRLSHAAEGGHIDVVKLLLQKESIEPDSKDEEGRTPLSHAAEGGYIDVVKLLLQTESIEPDL